MATSNWLCTVMVYGTSCARVTLSIGVVLLIATEPSSVGSSGRWLLYSWLEPGSWLPSSNRCTWWLVPVLRAGIEAGGASSDVCTSQCCAVPAIASSALPGQDGTANGAVA